MDAPISEKKKKLYGSVEKSIIVRGLRELGGDDEDSDEEDRTEVWFAIESTLSKGIYHREMLAESPYDGAITNIPRDPKISCNGLPKDAYYLGEACCVQVGFFLYVLGGRDHTEGMYKEISDTVRRFNLKNPHPNGWEACKPLPFPLGLSLSCVGGGLIYVFPRVRHGGGNADIPGGFIYNTTEQKVYDIQPPFGYEKFELWSPPFCFYHDFRDGRKGVVLAGSSSLYLYSQERECWDTLEKPELLQLKARNIKYAFSNGILYVSYWDWEYDWDFDYNPIRNHVCAYDVQTGAHLLGDGINVPTFEKLCKPGKISHDMSIVVVADFKLCYLWSESGSSASVTIAKVVFSRQDMSASVYEKEIKLNASWINNFLPCISPFTYEGNNEMIHWDKDRTEPRTDLDRWSSFFVGEIFVPVYMKKK